MIEHLLLDSRKLIFPESSLFFALKSARRNGHEYIKALHQAGVRNFIVSERIDYDQLPGSNIIEVTNTLQALQALAAFHRKQYNIPVIAITGSNGKTIVKEWLNQLLDNRYNIVRSPKSYNSQIGVPLSVWQMNGEHELAIFEAGISQTGEMGNLQKIIQPTMGIFTNIGEAHSEGFLNVRQKINEKLLLFVHVNVLIYCKDFPELNECIAALRQQLTKSGEKAFEVVSWSTMMEAELKILKIGKETDRTVITGEWQQQPVEITIPFVDDASIENAIHCWCTLLHLQISKSLIETKMTHLGQVAMRLELKKGINNCTIINDSYSADLSSLKIALDFLSHQQQHPRRTVILSDILESGKSEKELYKQIAQALQQRNVNRLIGIGNKISEHQPAFTLAGIPELLFYDSVKSFKNNFYHLHFRDETILVKGARIFEFEQIDHLLEQKVHQTLMEIDLNAVVHNLEQFQRMLQPTTKLMVMVKAFSYGSGSYEIANVLQYHKVNYLAVAYTDEGVDLRKGGITLPIMVMNIDESDLDLLLQYNLEPDLYSLELLRNIELFLRKQGVQQFPVHIELETGMNRLGFSLNELQQMLDIIKSPFIKVQTVFTHLAASEDPAQDNFTSQQADIFLDMCKAIADVLPYSFMKHIDNSAGIIRHPFLQMDMVRLGIGLYGIDTSRERILDLQEVSTLKSTIAQMKFLKKGETVSYNRKGELGRDSTIATVRIGYADGYPRSLSNGKGQMWVRGQLAPVVGIVCMDMTMIDVTDITDVEEGDEVIIFGKQLPVTQVAHWAQTIPYEILTGISQRVKRVYYYE